MDHIDFLLNLCEDIDRCNQKEIAHLLTRIEVRLALLEAAENVDHKEFLARTQMQKYRERLQALQQYVETALANQRKAG